jgi:hypothetical protein
LPGGPALLDKANMLNLSPYDQAGFATVVKKIDAQLTVLPHNSNFRPKWKKAGMVRLSSGIIKCSFF